MLAATATAIAASEPVVLGILSLIIWALLLVVTAKYVLILLRADNKGEGGTLALMALASRSLVRRGGIVILLGIISGALVLRRRDHNAGAVGALGDRRLEGRHAGVRRLCGAAHGLHSRHCCSAVQSRGTANVAAFFGPITLFWFCRDCRAQAFGMSARNPTVLSRIQSRGTAVSFLLHHGIVGFYTLGAVFLVVTGAEALYADLGHFGRGPIRFAWLVVVLPALTLNYLGQGALVLAESESQSKIRSFCSIPTGRCCRWCCSRPPLR